MFQLMEEHYDNIKLEHFENDLMEKNPVFILNDENDAIHHISYKSRIYLVDWDKTGQLKDDLNDQFPVNPECSLI